MSPDQAIATIRAWAQDPALTVTLRGVYYDPQRLRAALYALEAPGGQEFDVDCYDGRVMEWRSVPAIQAYNERVAQDLESPLTRVDQSQIESTALAFARQRFPGFDAAGMQLRVSGPGNIGFARRLPGGVWYPAHYSGTQVDEFTGDVCGYVAFQSEPVSIGLTPTLSSPQAESIALGHLAAADPSLQSSFIRGVTELHIVVDSLRQQRLCWIVKAAVSQEADYTYGLWVENGGAFATSWDVFVDTLSGEIAYKDHWLGQGPDTGKKPSSRKPKTVRFPRRPSAAPAAPAAPAARVLLEGKRELHISYRPQLREGVAYWYAGYLRSPLWGMKLERQGRKLTLTHGARRFGLEDDRPMLLADGRAVPLARAPVVLKGRTYLPQQVWEAITGDRFEWSAAERALIIRRAPKFAAAGVKR